jgi:hypothetical protein
MTTTTNPTNCPDAPAGGSTCDIGTCAHCDAAAGYDVDGEGDLHGFVFDGYEFQTSGAIVRQADGATVTVADLPAHVARIAAIVGGK